MFTDKLGVFSSFCGDEYILIDIYVLSHICS